MLVISTAHLAPGDVELLTDVAGVYEKGEYGYFVNIPAKEHQRDDLPQSLQDILDFGRDSQAEWVMIDRDAEIVDRLPTYDW